MESFKPSALDGWNSGMIQKGRTDTASDSRGNRIC